MSPRRQEPSSRSALINAAARLVAQGGTQALSVQRLAAATGTSAMAVHQYFGSMNELVREIAMDGFERLRRLFQLVEETDDPVADLAMLGWAYWYNALTNGHTFELMFGASNLAGFTLSDDDRRRGRQTLGTVAEYAGRCVADGRFAPDDPVLIAHRMWTGVHGTTVLELGRYLVPPYDSDGFLRSQLVSLMTGAGDEPARAQASVAASCARFARDFGPAT